MGISSIRLLFSHERFLAYLAVQDSYQPSLLCDRVIPSLWTLRLKGMKLSNPNKDQWVRFHTCTTGERLPLQLYLLLLLSPFFF